MNTKSHKEKLEAEKKLLISELSGIGQIVNEKTGDWEVVLPKMTEEVESDENAKADRFEDFEEQSARMKVLKGRLDDIEHALLKIDGKTYGICEICGSKIEEDRLDANPAAKTCKTHINE